MNLYLQVEPTPFGPVRILSSDDGLVACALGEGDVATLTERLRDDELRAATVVLRDGPWSAEARAWISEYVTNGPLRAPPPLRPHGTSFQRRVWAALLELGVGETVSYSELAGRVGAPSAARAVGGAVGANPLALFIPCHRVLAQDGGLGGFAWGPGLKAKLLEHEARLGRPTPIDAFSASPRVDYRHGS